MKYFTDYHTHTEFSCDSTAPLDKMCERAIALGMQELALTDHADFLSFKTFEEEIDLATRQQAIIAAQEKYGDRCKILNGIEIGQPQANPAEYERMLQLYPFDFIIGSIHNLPNDVEINHLDYSQVNDMELYTQFMEEEIKLVQNYDFDVLGHITMPQRYLYRRVRRSVDLTKFEEQYRELFRLLIAREKGIEVNTSGIRQGIDETMPNALVLKWYRECGGKIITVGSDAHTPQDLGAAIPETYQMLRELGFTHVMSYEKREYKAHKLD